MEENKTFQYTYSAKQQEEIQKIREKYLPSKEDKLEQLRKLDKKVENAGLIWALAVGVIGTLILGLGMSLVLVWGKLVLGIPVGVVGMIGVALAFPIYMYIIKKQRETIAPQILKLTEELSKQK